MILRCKLPSDHATRRRTISLGLLSLVEREHNAPEARPIERNVPSLNAMTLIRFPQIGLLLLLTSGCLTSWAQSHDDQTERVIQKYMDAIGGRERYDALQSISRRGTVTGEIRPDLVVSTMPVSVVQKAKLLSYAAKQNKKLTFLSLEGRATSVIGCDGKAGWQYDESGTLDAPWACQIDSDWYETDAFEHSDLAFNDGALIRKSWCYLRTSDINLHYLGRRRVEGRNVEVIRATGSRCEPSEYYFDSASGLLLRIVRRWQPRPEARLRQEISFSDFRTINGALVFPFKVAEDIEITLWRWHDQRAVTKYDAIEVNTPLSSAIFQRPADKHKPVAP
jgi:hypothetical protein